MGFWTLFEVASMPILQEKGCEDVKAVISALKSKGVSDVRAAGFCWRAHINSTSKLDDLNPSEMSDINITTGDNSQNSKGKDKIAASEVSTNIDKANAKRSLFQAADNAIEPEVKKKGQPKTTKKPKVVARNQ
ncbi:unnamed protein product [Fraxinus pennsylvanica]|uniref:Uncharacterized protein n=1 Tax=Fraxinus pennsylvanica TaxID=56036 RepID=A0AAD1Z4K3_9LAMI|nr:unnamed protein product [Fraxinus pennsylvanica]